MLRRSQKRDDLLAPVACGIALVAAVAALALRYPASIWSVSDYGLDSLSGALNLAYRLGDVRFYPAPSMENHPGVPHYLLSWIGLALAGFPRATSNLGFFNDVLDHVERFHAIMIALSALTAAAGVVLFMRAASGIVPLSVSLLAVLLGFVSTPHSLLTLLWLSVDAFGLILSALFVIVLWRMAREPRLQPSSMILAGAVGAAAYLTKLSYINLPIGLVAAIGIVFLAGRGGRGWTALMALLAVYAFAAFILVVAFWFIEWSSFRALLDFHASVIGGTGLYGTGPSGVVDGSQLWDAVRSIPADRVYAIPIAVVGGLILVGAGAVTAIFRKEQLPAAIFAVGVGIAGFVSGFSVLKHYAEHYSAAVSCIVPACVIAAFVMLDAWNVRPRRKILAAALVAAVVCALAVPFMLRADEKMADDWRRTVDAEADARIIARYIGTGPLVGFAYSVPFREYGEGFLLANIQVPQLTFQYLAEHTGTMSSVTQHLVQRDVGVFVIDKHRIGPIDALKAADNFNVLGPTEKYQATDEVMELKTVYLLVRKPAPGTTGKHD